VYDGNNTPPAGDEAFISIADLARAVRKRLWLLVLIALLCVGAAVGVSFLTPPVYEASATVVVGPIGPQDNLSSGISGLQMLAGEMATVGLNPSMAEEVASVAGVPPSELGENLAVAQIEGTRFLSFTYTSASPDEARSVANGAVGVFAREGPDASGMASEAAMKVISRAPEPQALQGPSPVRSGLLALAVGLMLGAGLAFFLERFGFSSWKSSEEVEQFSGVPTFGTIPALGRKRAGE
jgi:capsular polysaccharide biosynthesis protein